MWYFTVSSSNPELEGPNDTSLGSYLSTWFLTFCFLPIYLSFFSLLLLLLLKILEHMEFNWHLNPEDKCLNKPMGVGETWGLVEENQKGMKVSHLCFLLIQIPLGMFCSALEGSGILASNHGRPSLTSKRGLHGCWQSPSSLQSP